MIRTTADSEKPCGSALKDTAAFNTPFAGTIVPMEYYKKDARVHSVMIEVNRRLYLKVPGVKSDGFADTKAVLTECIRLAERFVRE